jgi:hypothetical protein
MMRWRAVLVNCSALIHGQLLPKRADHYSGIEHIFPQQLMIAKMAEAAAANLGPGARSRRTGEIGPDKERGLPQGAGWRA